MCRAFEEAFTKYHGFVRGSFRRLAGNDAVADDLTQDVFVGLLQAVRSNRDIADMKSYLSGAVTRVFRHYLRRERYRQADPHELKVRRSCPEPSAGIAASQGEEMACELLECLPPEQRLLVVAVVYLEMKPAHIVAEFGLTSEQFRYRYAQARQFLQTEARRRGLC